MGEVVLTGLSAEPLDVAAHLAAVATSGTGAVATFTGLVRDHRPDADREVVRLEYSAHPDAARVLAEVAADVAAAHPRARMAVSHRAGVLDVGGRAVRAWGARGPPGLAVTGGRELGEPVKGRVPVWKKQVLADGSHTWVNSA